MDACEAREDVMRTARTDNVVAALKMGVPCPHYNFAIDTTVELID